MLCIYNSSQSLNFECQDSIFGVFVRFYYNLKSSKSTTWLFQNLVSLVISTYNEQSEMYQTFLVRQIWNSNTCGYVSLKYHKYSPSTKLFLSSRLCVHLSACFRFVKIVAVCTSFRFFWVYSVVDSLSNQLPQILAIFVIPVLMGYNFPNHSMFPAELFLSA